MSERDPRTRLKHDVSTLDSRFSRPCALLSRYLSGKNHAPRRTFADARASGRRQRVRPTRGRRHNPPRRRGRDPESIPAIDRARAGTGTGMREIGKIDGGAIAVACAPDDLACDEVSLELDSPRSAIALMQPPSERARPRSARRRSVDAARPELTRFSARRARARGSANDASNNPRNAIGSVSVDTGLCLMDARDDDPTSPKIGNPEMGYAQLMPLVLHALSRLRCVPARVPAACLQPSALPRFSCYFFFPEPLSFFCRATPAPPRVLTPLPPPPRRSKRRTEGWKSLEDAPESPSAWFKRHKHPNAREAPPSPSPKQLAHIDHGLAVLSPVASRGRGAVGSQTENECAYNTSSAGRTIVDSPPPSQDGSQTAHAVVSAALERARAFTPGADQRARYGAAR